jgi:hypothetical protein
MRNFAKQISGRMTKEEQRKWTFMGGSLELCFPNFNACKLSEDLVKMKILFQ